MQAAAVIVAGVGSAISVATTVTAYLFIGVSIVGAVAVVTKPSEKSLEPYADQWSRKNKLQRRAEELVGKSTSYQDLIVCRLASDDENSFVGVFGAWFRL